MGQVFISYRRDDHAGYVRALLNEIKARFGEGQAFLDLESIDAGTDFAAAIEAAIAGCEVLLIMIGPKWLQAGATQGHSRLHDPGDFVRLEILTALRRQIPAIPVLVDGAAMPTEADLPSELARLPRLQAVHLSNANWDSDIAKLFAALERVSEEPRLTRDYLHAQDLSRRGLWREALECYRAIESRRPNFRDVHERLQPLEELARQLERRGPGSAGWRRLAARSPVFAMLLASLPPNLLAGLFNFAYNERSIVQPLLQRGVPDAEDSFRFAALLVNAVGFPLGIAGFAYVAWPVRRVLARCLSAVSVDAAQLDAARRRLLQLPHLAAILGTGLWVLAAPFYPLFVGAMESRDYLHFILSLLFCGLIASVYPYFCVAFLCLRVLYPGLVPPGSASEVDETELERFDRLAWRYLVMAGALPMLTITVALMLSPLNALAADTRLLGILGVAGIVGLGAAIGLFRLNQSDLAGLKRLVRASSPAAD